MYSKFLDPLFNLKSLSVINLLSIASNSSFWEISKSPPFSIIALASGNFSWLFPMIIGKLKTAGSKVLCNPVCPKAPPT